MDHKKNKWCEKTYGAKEERKVISHKLIENHKSALAPTKYNRMVMSRTLFGLRK